MEVMCVLPFPEYKGGEDVSFPQVGDKDTVTDAVESKGYVWYELKRFGTETLYRADHFGILPAQDADMIEEGVYEAIVPIPEPVMIDNSHLHPTFKNILNAFISR